MSAIKQHAVVVGGGIAGLLAARMLTKTFEKVTLIEREQSVGGLLRSVSNEHGDTFDYGTHVLRETGIAELDGLLFEMLDQGEWNYFDYLLSGNFFGNSLNEESPFLDVRKLPSLIYEKGLIELLSLGFPPERSCNLSAQLKSFYGDTFTEYVFRPIMQKLFGTPLENLAENAHKLFGLSRLIALSPETTKEIKKSSLFDAKLGFHYRQDSPPATARSFYPKQGGIGKWVAAFGSSLQNLGVDIKTSRQIESITLLDGKQVIALKSGENVTSDFLVWTVPPGFLLKACDTNFPSKPPLMRKVTLFHLTFDSPFLPKLFYIHCYDERFASFRITLYPNLRLAADRKRYECTVEVLTTPEAPFESIKISDKVLDELQQMGVVSPSAKLLNVVTDSVQVGFPVITKEFVEQNLKQTEYIKQKMTNVLLLGRASGNSFFMDDVLRDTYHTLKSLGAISSQ